MNAGEEERLADDPEEGLDEDSAEDEFDDEDEEVSAELEAEFEDGGDGEDDEEIEAVVELSAKEQSARSLEIRRAIEERMEQRQLEDDLDYLDADLDD